MAKRKATQPTPKPSFKERMAAASERAERKIEERPRAPWDPFPLTELAIFLAFVGVIAGFAIGGDIGKTVIGIGIALGCFGGLDTAMREHLAGYRSHAGILAGGITLIVLFVLSRIPGMTQVVALAVIVVVFAVTFGALRRLYLMRSGGKRF